MLYTTPSVSGAMVDTTGNGLRMRSRTASVLRWIDVADQSDIGVTPSTSRPPPGGEQRGVLAGDADGVRDHER